MNDLIRKIELILIETGQHDKNSDSVKSSNTVLMKLQRYCENMQKNCRTVWRKQNEPQILL